MKKIKDRIRWVYVLSTVLCMALFIGFAISAPVQSRVHAQAPVTPEAVTAENEGSGESVKEGPFKFDTDNNLTISVFESVLNDIRLEAGHYSRMRFFVAPFLQIIPYSNTASYLRTEISSIGKVRYTFRFRNYDPALDDEILRFINRSYSAQTGLGQPFTAEQVNLLEHGLIVISPRLPSELQPVISPATIPNDPLAPLDTRVILRSFETFSLDVPLSVDEPFRQLADAGLGFDFTIFFNVKDVSQLNLNFSADELLNTERYRNLSQSGGAFVTAEQMQEIIREAISRRNVSIIIDPGIDARLQAYAFEIFSSFLEEAKTAVVNSAREAHDIDAELAEGIGINPSDFQPITLMWEVHEIISNASSSSEANANMRDWYERNREEVETVRERFKESEWKVEASGSYAGIVSGGAEYRELNRAFDRDETANLEDNINSGYFTNEESFTDAQQTHRDATGMEVEIVARGLELIERSSFENKVRNLVAVQISVPANRAASFVNTSGVATDLQEYQDSITLLLDKVGGLETSVGGPTKIASGSTEVDNTAWVVYSSNGGIYVDVNTSAAGFTNTPRYVASLGGRGRHWETTGGSAIYNASATGFRIYIRYVTGRDGPTPDEANELGWHITWIGIEE